MRREKRNLTQTGHTQTNLVKVLSKLKGAVLVGRDDEAAAQILRKMKKEKIVSE